LNHTWVRLPPHFKTKGIFFNNETFLWNNRDRLGKELNKKWWLAPMLASRRGDKELWENKVGNDYTIGIFLVEQMIKNLRGNPV
jgi:hypothetical protein